MNRPRPIALLAVMTLIPGCAWIPDEGSRARFIPPPALERTLADARTAEPYPPSAHWPLQLWWRRFASAELDQLMDLALKDNPGLKAASARLRNAEALARVEGARLLPFLDAQAGVETARLSGNGFNVVLRGAHVVDAFVTPLSLRYQFDFWGKHRAALNAALGEAAAEAAERAEVQLQLTTAVARGYFRGLALRRQLDLAGEQVGLRRDLLQLAQTRSALGLDSEDPIRLATIELETSVQREAATQQHLALQRNLLANLTGRGPDATRQLFGGSVNLPERLALPDRLAPELLNHRPDLAAARHRTEAAAERIKVAKANFLPTVDLTSFAGLSALRMTKGASALANVLFSGSSFAYGVAPGVRLPLFEGGKLRGELSAQRAEYDAAVESYNKTLLQAVQEVADSLAGWRQAGTLVEAQQRLLDDQRGAQALAENRLQAGLDDRRLLLTRRTAVLNQEFVLKTLEADRLLAVTDLIEALGGGYAAGPANSTQLTPPE